MIAMFCPEFMQSFSSLPISYIYKVQASFSFQEASCVDTIDNSLVLKYFLFGAIALHSHLIINI